MIFAVLFPKLGNSDLDADSQTRSRRLKLSCWELFKLKACGFWLVD